MSKQLGVGVMFRMLSDNAESVRAWQSAVGKDIADLKLEDDALVFRFTDGTGLKLSDEGQSCCEHRYMTSDDDLAYFVGAKLLDAEVREVANRPVEDEDGEHEVQFLLVTTSKGVFTMESHNEHNGFYGGFAVCAAVI